ncbi:MAG: isoprenyl transferase [Syntrophorhabdaceae bacterium]|nr:isoprenyl transferase [Syntrophorhabdaceae bacterium]
MEVLETGKLPNHVAIIMDGNGRWARQRGLPRIEGHIKGLDSVREIITVTRRIGIPYLTLYAFSKENWSRPKDEVQRLLELLGLYLEKELPLMMENDIRFNVIGRTSDFPKRLVRQLNDVMTKTKRHRSLLLNIALSYSGRQEILDAVKAIIKDVKLGKVKRIDEKRFSTYLYTGGIPDPDLLIRTSGEMRVSNFLLWQIAYSEIYITPVLWPDFREEAYFEALREYAIRDRRFGGLKEV